ncbi:MAG TPA: glycosyl hydrolase [Candidatus Limnocylindrales bacterium]|nr:glycosyl hydrolase [Candidatus Limnocylindrales bacterium]
MLHLPAITAVNLQVAKGSPFHQRLRKPIRIKIARTVVTVLLLGMFATTWRAGAATNAVNFSPTTLPAGAGPANPSNGAVTINGSNLTAGDVIVFDGLVANVNGTIGDNWGSINLNASGFLGLTGARFGVLLRTGTGALQCQIYANGVAGPMFPGTTEIRTNRVVISLYVSKTGSTTNLGYRVQIDQGFTGSFTSTLSGTNLTFPGNSMALTFSAYNAAELFVQIPPLQGIHLQLPHTNLLAGAADQSVVTMDYLSVSNVAPIYNPGFVYASSDPNVVTVSSQGLLQAKGDGTATITVAYSTFSDSEAVTVVTNSGALQAVRLVVTNQMQVNGTQPAGVRGDFDNVADVDLLSYGQPALVPANSNLLTISAAGVITAIGPGSTTVTASYDGLASTKTITVTFPTKRFIFDTFGDGFWKIVNVGNSNSLVVNSVGASQAIATNTAFDQQFELLYNYVNSTFRIRNRSSWLCIGTQISGTSVGAGVTTISYSGTASQQWYFVDAGNGLYRIINRASNYALQTDNGNPATVTIAPASMDPAQLWSFSYQTHYPKKGWAGYEGNYSQFGLNWAYNYNDNTGTALPAAVNYVPMIYAAQYWEPLSDAQARAAGWRASAQPVFLLAYNEPDNSGANGGSNTSTNEVIALWPQIQALNVPLVSPACATTYGSWAYSFFSMIASANYRVDYTAAHMYQSPNASSLIGNLQNVYNTWGRPVWLTEFSPVDWSNTQSWSEQDNFNFLAEFMWLAEDNLWFKRYSIFPFSGTPSTNPWDVNGHRGDYFLADGSTLTPYGELYATWDANRTVQARTPYFIHNLATSFRLTSTNFASAPQSSSIRVRDASTQWALLPAVTANRYYIISLKDGRRLRDTSGALNLAPPGTTGAAVEWWFNGPDSKGYYYIDNTAASQSVRGSGSAPAITFSMINDPAPSTATQWRIVKPYQPVTIVTAVPPSLSITYSNQSARLNWTGNGSFYNVYRGTNSGGGYTKIVSLATNSTYLDSPVQNGTAYFYVMTALNILGEESAYSTEVIARPASTMLLPVSFSVLYNGLQFDWPADHTGWRLQMNTDLTAPGGWTTVSNSASTNQMWLPFDVTQSNIFFRLIFP